MEYSFSYVNMGVIKNYNVFLFHEIFAFRGGE